MSQNAKKLIEASLGDEIAENQILTKIEHILELIDSPKSTFIDHFCYLYDKTLKSLIGSNSKESKLEYFKWLDFDYLKEINGTTSNLTKALHNKGYTNLMVIGMGGSGINALVLKDALYANKPYQEGSPEILIQNNLDPASLYSKLEQLKAQDKLNKTAFAFISKSGGTDEVKRNLSTILDYFTETAGSRDKALEQFAKQAVFITENNKSNFLNKLREEIKDKTNTEIAYIEHHPEIGGRFSMFSPVGMFAAQMMGLNSNKLLIGAEECFKNLCNSKGLENSVIGKMALYDILLYRQGYRNRYSMVYSDSLESLNKFRAQLRGESLNKNKIDSTMHIAGVGTVNHHSDLELLFKDNNQVILEQLAFAEPLRDHQNKHEDIKSLKDLTGQSNYQSLIQGHILPVYQYLKDKKKPVILTIIDKQNEESMGYYLMHDMLCTVMQAGLQDRLDDAIRQHEVERYKKDVKKHSIKTSHTKKDTSN